MSREETLRQEAIYARQSVDKKDSVSIETQIDHCKNFAESPNPKIFKMCIRDSPYTVWYLERSLFAHS